MNHFFLIAFIVPAISNDRMIQHFWHFCLFVSLVLIKILYCKHGQRFKSRRVAAHFLLQGKCNNFEPNGDPSKTIVLADN